MLKITKTLLHAVRTAFVQQLRHLAWGGGDRGGEADRRRRYNSLRPWLSFTTKLSNLQRNGRYQTWPPL